MSAATNPPRADSKHPGVAPPGRRRIAWAERGMPGLRAIRERLETEKPPAGLRMSACLHVTDTRGA